VPGVQSCGAEHGRPYFDSSSSDFTDSLKSVASVFAAPGSFARNA